MYNVPLSQFITDIILAMVVGVCVYGLCWFMEKITYNEENKIKPHAKQRKK